MNIDARQIWVETHIQCTPFRMVLNAPVNLSEFQLTHLQNRDNNSYIIRTSETEEQWVL